ncbi:hypothetical protein V1281_006951 [Nitrobacteraceae bacterium AZCC 2161]
MVDMDTIHGVIDDGLHDKNMSGSVPVGQQSLIDRAPLLERWIVVFDKQTVAFSGIVEGKPRQTEAISWVDYKWRWIYARGFFRLGPWLMEH